MVGDFFVYIFCFVHLFTIGICLHFLFLPIGTKSLAEILSDRESIAKDMLTTLDESTDPWGIKVKNKIKNIFLKLNGIAF